MLLLLDSAAARRSSRVFSRRRDERPRSAGGRAGAAWTGGVLPSSKAVGMESSGTGRTWFWLACADSSRTFWREARPPRSEDFRLAIFALGKRTLMGDMASSPLASPFRLRAGVPGVAASGGVKTTTHRVASKRTPSTNTERGPGVQFRRRAAERQESNAAGLQPRRWLSSEHPGAAGDAARQRPRSGEVRKGP